MGSCWIQQPGCVLLGELLLAVGRARGWLGSLSAGLCLFMLALSGVNPVRFVMLAVFCGVLAF